MTLLMTLALLLSSGPCVEPWARCSPDAFWLRRVIARAGFMELGDTGSALSFVARCGPPCGPAGEWNVWAVPGTRRPPVQRLVSRVDGRPVYGDGVRIVWTVQKRRVWMSDVSGRYPPPRRVVVSLVRASLAVRR